MIFRQHEEVLSGVKSQTRRLVKEDDFAGNMHGRVVPDDVWGNRIDTVYDKNGRVRWQVGKTYAVQPGRGKPSVMYKIDPSGDVLSWDWGRADSRISVAETKRQLVALGWREGRIRITEIRREQVKDISEENAMAEGIYDTGWFGWSYGTEKCFSTAISAFRGLWNSIHKKPGARFEDDPETWALTFETI